MFQKALIACRIYKHQPWLRQLIMDNQALRRVVKDAGIDTFFHVYPRESVQFKRQLGDGGFACVWEGTLQICSDVGSRPVAIKVMHPGTKEKELKMFFQEARAALTATGVHVCQLLGAGRPAFLWPLYKDNVHDLMDDECPGGMPVWLTLRVIQCVAHGLLDMHTKRIVHLDLKPLNILVNGHSDEVVITDFGLSTMYTSTLSGVKTNVGAASGAGTLSYMSLEQINSKAFATPGPKSDIWALGCVAIHLFTNQRPHFKKTATQIMFDVGMNRDPPPVPSSLPRDVAQLVESLLQSDPKDRPTSAEAMKRLTQLVAAHPKPSKVRCKCGSDAALRAQIGAHIPRFRCPLSLHL